MSGYVQKTCRLTKRAHTAPPRIAIARMFRSISIHYQQRVMGGCGLRGRVRWNVCRPHAGRSQASNRENYQDVWGALRASHRQQQTGKSRLCVVLDHKGGKGYLLRRNKIAIFNKDGGAIVSRSTRSLGNSVQDGCDTIVRDWAGHNTAVAPLAPGSASFQPTPAKAELAPGLRPSFCPRFDRGVRSSARRICRQPVQSFLAGFENQ
jgi:hypothetical protein